MAPHESHQRGMKAAELSQYNKPYELKTRELPQIAKDELLIHVRAAGFCHSDLQVLQGQFPTQLPIIPSHEPAGVVVGIGSECPGGWKLGDRVGVLNFKNSCGKCTGCRLSMRKQHKHDPRFCVHRKTAGFRHDGAFAEYMVADPRTTVPLTEGISFEQAAPLMCAGATVWGALEKATAGLQPDDAVGIVGIGGLGHLALQFAKALGHRVVAIDSRAAGRELATAMENPALKPDLVVDSLKKRESTDEIYAFTNGEGLAAVVACTDSLEANAWSLELLRIQGVLIVLGLPPEKWQFDSSLMVFKELTIRGSYVADTESTKRMMAIVEKHNVQSHLTVITFESLPEIVQMYQESSFKGRLVVRISQDN